MSLSTSPSRPLSPPSSPDEPLPVPRRSSINTPTTARRRLFQERCTTIRNGLISDSHVTGQHASVYQGDHGVVEFHHLLQGEEFSNDTANTTDDIITIVSGSARVTVVDYTTDQKLELHDSLIIKAGFQYTITADQMLNFVITRFTK